MPLGSSLDVVEKEMIMRTIEFTAGNKTRAAEILGVSAKLYTTSWNNTEALAECPISFRFGFSMVMMTGEFVTCIRYKLPVKLVLENNANMDEMRHSSSSRSMSPGWRGRCSFAPDYRRMLARPSSSISDPPCQASDYHNELGGLNRLGNVHLIAR